MDSTGPGASSAIKTGSTVQYAGQSVCTPPFPDSPYGNILDLPAMYAQNDTYIAMIGPSIPVLLTSGDNDTTDPPSSAVADFDYYNAHCGCDVSAARTPLPAVGCPGTATAILRESSLGA